jgi:hypothetical protein
VLFKRIMRIKPPPIFNDGRSESRHDGEAAGYEIATLSHFTRCYILSKGSPRTRSNILSPVHTTGEML